MSFLDDNFGEYQEQKEAPTSRYPLKIVSATMKETSGKGKLPPRPMLNLGFRIADDEENQYKLANLMIIGTQEGDAGHGMQIMAAKRLAHWFDVDQEAFRCLFEDEAVDTFAKEDFVGAACDDISVTKRKGEGEYKDRTYSDVNLPTLPETG